MCGDATKAGESGILRPELSTRDLFEINLAVRKGASEKGLILDDSKYTDAPMGCRFTYLIPSGEIKDIVSDRRESVPQNRTLYKFSRKGIKAVTDGMARFLGYRMASLIYAAVGSAACNMVIFPAVLCSYV